MDIFNLLFANNLILVLTKVFFLATDLMFILFLIVVLRQVTLMQALVNVTNDSFVLKSIIIALIIGSVSLFLTALVIL
ncbi:MAG: hypothetical protein UR81_C0008G0012 [Candidatus Levybacteria bacterium GW2011_GWB1_35_5]|nr:MAG: hypothetical protein UR81_C0008G0012 [Candidatus Levybacteria bacterium GW2011_GWB1_35_5]